MRLLYNKDHISGKYDKRNLSISKSGLNRYPSKKMFIEFLKKYKDIPGTAEIWSIEDITNGTVTIILEVKYKLKRLPKKCLK